MCRRRSRTRASAGRGAARRERSFRGARLPAMRQRAEHVEAGVAEHLVGGGLLELVDGRLHAGRTARDRAADAAVRVVPQHLDRDVRPRQTARTCGSSITGTPSRSKRVASAASASSATRSFTWWLSTTGPRSFVSVCIAECPARVQLAEHALARNDDVLEVDLAELRVAGHLHERPHVDPRRLMSTMR